MHAHKFSISIPDQQFDFIEKFRKDNKFKTRSEVIKAALELLQQSQLEIYYKEANSEISKDWDITVGDGLSDESW
jgi:antitoxin ParD1/3/4